MSHSAEALDVRGATSVAIEDERLVPPALTPSVLGRAPQWWMWAVGWSFLGLLAAVASSLVSTMPAGVRYAWWQVLLINAPWWIGWALATPAVIWVARRYRLDDPTARRRSIVAHVIAAAAIGTVHLAVTIILAWLAVLPRFAALGAPPHRVLINTTRMFLDSYFVMELFTYGAVLAMYYALDFRRRHRESELVAARLQLQASVLREHTAQARLLALQRELNPHFLFNALNSASGLVRSGRGADAVQMLAHLGSLLRAALGHGRGRESSLGDELQLLERYLDIERVRFGERLQVEWEIEPAARDQLVPSLLLQPLVENAVRHGIAPLPQGGRIRVSARVVGETIHISVRDNGRGFPVEEATRSSGVGLSNTSARLDALYGAQAALSVSNAPDEEGGALIELVLPRRAARADGAPGASAD